MPPDPSPPEHLTKATSHAGPSLSARTRRSWTSWEDQTLRSRVAHYGDARGSNGRWKDIACGIPGRTAKDCRKRWFHSLDPSLRKGKWTADEDRVLLEAYSRIGPSWHEIAALIPGRKDDQCSKRYNDILNPLVQSRLTSWTIEEDRILREGVQSLGHRWSAISARLPGRPPLTCRNRWRNLSKQQQDTSPGTSDNQTEQPNEALLSENDLLESPESPAVPTDIDMPGGIDFPDSGDPAFSQFDPLVVDGLDVHPNSDFFDDHLQHVTSQAFPANLSSVDMGPTVPPVAGTVDFGAGIGLPSSRDMYIQPPGSQSQTHAMHPSSNDAHQQALVHTTHSTGSTTRLASSHLNDTTAPQQPGFGDGANPSQLRAAELAAEAELGADQQALSSDRQEPLDASFHADEHQVEIRSQLGSSNTSANLHHHHHHHYHHHHHHHHYHHYPF